MDKHLLRTVNRAKKRIEDFQEEMPTWKVQDTQQYVERLEQTIKRMHSTSSELKIDIAGAKQEITNSNSIDDIKWNELIEEADKVLMESRDLINDLEDEVYNVRTSPKSVVKGSNALGSEIAPRLPQLSLPVFTGRAWDWPNFYASFKERVDSGPYSKLDKFEYLRQSLCGEALSTISTYIVEAGNYELALNRLKDHYGNQQLIISEMQNQLARISLRNESWHEQKQMVNTMLSLYNQLKRAGAVVDNEWVWKNIYQKFPTETTRELRKTTSIMKNTTDVEMLLTELDKLLIENITEEAIDSAFHPVSRLKTVEMTKDVETLQAG
ncbi:hypothetical protein QR680_002405 [Steinernema hermaphroditum]|uniref:Uncharacterized protein n=1 Tax=Steinernema hermaphroditum TaxID=289476 RepID=A0AA39H3H2_9BILA|nr:hypothetical protein QR680_002405 [Steinernema hermaphroditum]